MKGSGKEKHKFKRPESISALPLSSGAKSINYLTSHGYESLTWASKWDRGLREITPHCFT